MKVNEELKAYLEGMKAANRGVPHHACPYQYGSIEGEAWVEGYLEEGGCVDDGCLEVPE